MNHGRARRPTVAARRPHSTRTTMIEDLKHLRADTELKRDLWPDMRRRIDQRSVRVSVFDGALLPFLLAPGGLLLAHLFQFSIPRVLPYLFPVGVAVYYLIWKHIVARLNAIVGVA